MFDRREAAQFRAAVRRCVAGRPCGLAPPVHLQQTKDNLTLSAFLEEIAIALRLAKYIRIEVFHLTITAAPNQPQHIYDAIARAFGCPDFTQPRVERFMTCFSVLRRFALRSSGSCEDGSHASASPLKEARSLSPPSAVRKQRFDFL